MTFGYGWLMHTDMSIPGVQWMPSRMKSRGVSWMDFGGVWFHQNHMLGDSILTALNKMKQMDHHQHSDELLQEFYAMTQKHNDSIGKYAVRLNMAAGKVWLQSSEALGSTLDKRERLRVNRLLQSMNPMWLMARLQIRDLPIMTLSNLLSRRKQR